MGMNGQMMPQQGQMMWAGPPVQQAFIMDNRASQQDGQRRPNAGGGNPNSWDAGVAPFVPFSQRKMEEVSTPQFAANPTSFDKPSPEKSVNLGDGEKKRKPKVANARIDKADKTEKDTS